jgi:hypothetical protein
MAVQAVHLEEPDGRHVDRSWPLGRQTDLGSPPSPDALHNADASAAVQAAQAGRLLATFGLTISVIDDPRQKWKESEELFVSSCDLHNDWLSPRPQRPHLCCLAPIHRSRHLMIHPRRLMHRCAYLKSVPDAHWQISRLTDGKAKTPSIG